MKHVIAVICVLVFTLTMMKPIIAHEAFAQDLEEDQALDKQIERFDQINEELQQDLADKKRAELLSEKALLMLGTFGAVFSQRTATNCLLKAIKLDPENDVYKEYLCEVYNELWANQDYPGDDEVLRSMQRIKDETKSVVEQYKARQLKEVTK